VGGSQPIEGGWSSTIFKVPPNLKPFYEPRLKVTAGYPAATPSQRVTHLMAARIGRHGVEGRRAGILAGAGHDVLDLGELLPQHLLLVEAESGVVGRHGEEQQELIPGAALVELQPVVVDDGIDVGEGPEKDPGSLAVGRAQQGERDQQFAAHHLVRQVGEAAQVGGVVGLDLGVSQRVVILPSQVLQAGSQETQLQRDAQIQQAAQKLHSLRGGQLREPTVHPVPLQPRAALLHHGAPPTPGPQGAHLGSPRTAPSALPAAPPGAEGARRYGAAPRGGQGPAEAPRGRPPGVQARALRRGLAAGSPPGRPRAGLGAPSRGGSFPQPLHPPSVPVPERRASSGAAPAHATAGKESLVEGSAEADGARTPQPARGGGIPR